MKLLVFDTETTGLPKNNPSIYYTSQWPHIVQFSFLIYDTDYHTIESEHDYIIKVPDYIKISDESINIHGITKEKSMKEGIPITDVIKIFKEKMSECDIIVGHNISFDKRMVIVESIRHKIKNFFPKLENNYFCTMKKGKSLCEIVAKNSKTGEEFIKIPHVI